MVKNNNIIYIIIIIIGFMILTLSVLLITNFSQLTNHIVYVEKPIENADINNKLDKILDEVSESDFISNTMKDELVKDYTNWEKYYGKGLNNYSKIDYIINWLEERGYIK